jgi:hypothetical protein
VDDLTSERLHRQACAGERTVATDIFVLFAFGIVASLKPRFRGMDEQRIQDAVTDVILNYVARPLQYDPKRSRLDGYLKMAAHRDLLNAVEHDNRQPRAVSLDDVADSTLARNEQQQGVDRNTVLRDRLGFDGSHDEFMRFVDMLFADEVDRRIVRAMADGERDTATYVRLLGLEHLDKQAQARQVKRDKDRIKQRLRRNLAPMLEERAHATHT